MLLSGAGLLTFAIVSLWDTVRDQDRREREAAEQEARDTAEELRKLFQEDWVFDVFPAPFQFEVRGGKVTKPPPWMASPQIEWSELDLPLPVLELLQLARQQEFKNKDQALAERALRRALQDKSLSPAQRSYVASVAAWQAHRANQDERALRLFRQHARVRPGVPKAAASLLLLCLKLGAGSAPSDSGLCVGLAADASRLPLQRRSAPAELPGRRRVRRLPDPTR